MRNNQTRFKWSHYPDPDPEHWTAVQFLLKLEYLGAIVSMFTVHLFTQTCSINPYGHFASLPGMKSGDWASGEERGEGDHLSI